MAFNKIGKFGNSLESVIESLKKVGIEVEYSQTPVQCGYIKIEDGDGNEILVSPQEIIDFEDDQGTIYTMLAENEIFEKEKTYICAVPYKWESAEDYVENLDRLWSPFSKNSESIEYWSKCPGSFGQAA